MAQWAVIIPADQWATERLFHNEAVTVAGGAGAVAPDDEVLLVADGRVVALTRAAKTDNDDLVLVYLRRSFDDPVPAGGLTLAPSGPVEVEPDLFRRLSASLAGGTAPAGALPSWLVSVALPIEAATPAAAVRQFWSHVLELGPVELPTYVWPYGDELAMQAFVLGEEANQDPEEEDDQD
ncbi:hypothetical protein [Paractinoplanes rishiriensis]|uniref:Uncharacterized protein n=1 Tax=Paractinoplanes rishiriensis TaxID=1050105 RepID=A0A919K223_9ACTN|nr:hypothetical protein [Actinoplanes rishiriensis]GIE97802.1 hypothetical protein Ari01nite_52670 [Actinoplanes rishiriensis]